MLELYFSVQANTHPGELIQLVGSTKQLGQWDPKNAVVLSDAGQTWQGSITNVRHGVKLQFKIVKVKQNKQVEWQQLPENSNRKYRPKSTIQLHLVWGEAAGRISSVSRNTFKLKGLPAIMIKGQPSKKYIGSEEFDPYLKAHDEQSQDDNQEQFRLIKKKMSDIVSLNCEDLEEIYCKNCSVQILAALQKKEKIYVVSNSLQLSTKLQIDLQEQLNHLSGNYMTRWITSQCVKQEQKGKMLKNMKRVGSLFDVTSEELHLHSLSSKSSYFILTDLSVIDMMEKINIKISCCLYLPASKYDQVIDNLSKLKNIDIICFDSPSANKLFYQHLISRTKQIQPKQAQLDFLSISTPSVESIVLELKKLKQRLSDTYNSAQCIRASQIIKTVKKPNSITILDQQLVQDILDQLIDEQGAINQGHSMLIIICQTSIPSFLKNKPKNWVIIYDDFEKIKIKGKQYYPIRGFKQIIQQIKLKSLIYKESHGGQIVQKQSSLIYTLPSSKVDMAVKIQMQCSKILKKIGFTKISRKGSRVKISWNLSKQARMIRTICQLKYISHGPLGEFNLISNKMNFRDLKQEIKYLIECQSKMFSSGHKTDVFQYEFGSQINSNQKFQRLNEELDF